MEIVGIILFVMWVYSFFKFKNTMKYYQVLLQCIVNELQEDPSSYQTKLSLATALSLVQRYEDAYKIYSDILNSGSYIPEIDKIKTNMEFCKSPVPGATLKNYNSSWIHNFLLQRIGKRRYNFIRESDIMKANAYMRMNGQ